MFENLLNAEFKNVFNSAIDAILADTALTVPCLFKYSSGQIFCNNCIYDSISNRSSNIYNGTGPHFFPSYSICPICNSVGYIHADNNETIFLAVIFDSKFFLNWNSKTVNIPDGAVQTISKLGTISKIKNANSVVFNTKISDYALYEYVRDGDPNPCGLGDHNYITTMWKRK